MLLYKKYNTLICHCYDLANNVINYTFFPGINCMSGRLKPKYIGAADDSLTSYLNLAGSRKNFPDLPTICSKNTTPILGTYLIII